jgi:hypothetical protein
LRGQIGAPVECAFVSEELWPLRLRQNGDSISSMKSGQFLLNGVRREA